jgi:hypothetical protein
MSRLALAALVIASAMLSGCDMIAGALGVESPEKLAAAREAEGKAIGGACRHAGRAIEDCYGLNRKADKAAMFAGWRDMNDYMRENKIDAVAPQLTTQMANAVAKAAPDADGTKAAVGADKPVPKSAEGAKPRGRAPAKANDS